MQLYGALSIIFVMSLFSSSAQNGGSCKIPMPPEYGTLHMMGDPKVGSLALYSCDEDRKLVGASVSKCLINGQWTSPPPKCEPNRTDPQMFRPQPSKYPFFTLTGKSNLTDYQYVRPYVSRYPMPSVREETNLTDHKFLSTQCSRYPISTIRDKTNRTDPQMFRPQPSTYPFFILRGKSNLTDYQFVRPNVWRYPMPPVREETNRTDHQMFRLQPSTYPFLTLREKSNLTDNQYVRLYVSRYPMPSVREETNLTDYQIFRPQSSRYPIPTIREKTNLTDYKYVRPYISRYPMPSVREETNLIDNQFFRPQRSRYLFPILREKNILCPLIDEKDAFTVFYSDGRKINSTARVYCKDFNQQIAGLYNATCLSSGEWSYLNPECRVPVCTIKDFSENAPKNLVLDLNGVDGDLLPIGSELPLLCQKNMILHGNTKAKCGRHGQWSYGKSRCDPGCYLDPKSTSPELIIDPAKLYFSFGEHVKVLCQVGLKLSSNVEILVCMGNSWSDEIPKCL